MHVYSTYFGVWSPRVISTLRAVRLLPPTLQPRYLTWGVCCQKMPKSCITLAEYRVGAVDTSCGTSRFRIGVKSLSSRLVPASCTIAFRYVATHAGLNMWSVAMAPPAHHITSLVQKAGGGRGAQLSAARVGRVRRPSKPRASSVLSTNCIPQACKHAARIAQHLLGVACRSLLVAWM